MSKNGHELEKLLNIEKTPLRIAKCSKIAGVKKYYNGAKHCNRKPFMKEDTVVFIPSQMTKKLCKIQNI